MVKTEFSLAWVFNVQGCRKPYNLTAIEQEAPRRFLEHHNNHVDSWANRNNLSMFSGVSRGMLFPERTSTHTGRRCKKQTREDHAKYSNRSLLVFLDHKKPDLVENVFDLIMEHFKPNNFDGNQAVYWEKYMLRSTFLFVELPFTFSIWAMVSQKSLYFSIKALYCTGVVKYTQRWRIIKATGRFPFGFLLSRRRYAEK